jgi:hypothetical protein
VIIMCSLNEKGKGGGRQPEEGSLQVEELHSSH